MKKTLLAAAIALNLGTANAQVVNWLDTSVASKPPPFKINGPDEATTANKYWVNLSGGSGTTCSQAAPCGSLDAVLGKPGTQGGPAIIYVKGTGQMSWYEDTIFGSGDNNCMLVACPNWIKIRTWPAGSPGCAQECTATITGNSNMNSSNVHHIMWDGGPDLKIRFHSNGAGDTYANHISSNYHVVYRTQTYCSTSGVLGWQVGSARVAQNVWFINNEFHSCRNTGNQASAIYAGPGASGGYINLHAYGNVFRGWGGEAFEANNRAASSGLYIAFNDFYDNGQVTCSTSWKCRPHIVVASQNGLNANNIEIYNNRMWNSWSGCIWLRAPTTPTPKVYNNICYNYNRYGPENNNNPNPYGIEGNAADVDNNIFWPFTAGTDPLDPGTTYSSASNNACPSGESCGSSKQNWTTSQWLSITESNLNFLKHGASSVATNNGTSTAPTVVIDFARKVRPIGGAYDIGAYEYGTGATSTRPNAPGTN